MPTFSAVKVAALAFLSMVRGEVGLVTKVKATRSARQFNKWNEAVGEPVVFHSSHSGLTGPEEAVGLWLV